MRKAISEEVASMDPDVLDSSIEEDCSITWYGSSIIGQIGVFISGGTRIHKAAKHSWRLQGVCHEYFRSLRALGEGLTHSNSFAHYSASMGRKGAKQLMARYREMAERGVFVFLATSGSNGAEGPYRKLLFPERGLSLESTDPQIGSYLDRVRIDMDFSEGEIISQSDIA